MACSRNSTPVICGMRWATSRRATGSFRSLSFFSVASASLPDVAHTMRKSAPYSRRTSRSMAESRVSSPSTARSTGFVVIRLLLPPGLMGLFSDQLALELVASLLPVENATGIAAVMRLSVMYQVLIGDDARGTIIAGTVDDNLIILG